MKLNNMKLGLNVLYISNKDHEWIYQNVIICYICTSELEEASQYQPTL